jgi:hypothetical protein
LYERICFKLGFLDGFPGFWIAGGDGLLCTFDRYSRMFESRGGGQMKRKSARMAANFHE